MENNVHRVYYEIVDPDSEFGKKIGFTSDKFKGYLTRLQEYVVISLLMSKQPNQGNVRNLFEAIKREGFKIKVPCPIGRMFYIVKKNNFKLTHEWSEDMGEHVEVWVER